MINLILLIGSRLDFKLDLLDALKIRGGYLCRPLGQWQFLSKRRSNGISLIGPRFGSLFFAGSARFIYPLLPT